MKQIHRVFRVWRRVFFFLTLLLTVGFSELSPLPLTYLFDEQAATSTSPVESVEVTESEEDYPGILDQEFQSFSATAYCVQGVTHSGVWVRPGIIAADPDILPIGSVIEVRAGDYSGIYTVMDTGKLIQGRLIDIFIPDFEEAVQFGRQKIKLRVLRYGWHPGGGSLYDYSLAG